MLRYCLQLFPDASMTFRPLIITLAVIGIVYGAIVAIGQTDVMRLIAYTSISHFGFIILGIFVMTSQGQSGATLYMVNHGISTAALFLIAGFLVSRRGSRAIADFGGVQKVRADPGWHVPGCRPSPPCRCRVWRRSSASSWCSSAPSPATPAFAVFAASALVLSAIYILWAYQTDDDGAGQERQREAE